MHTLIIYKKPKVLQIWNIKKGGGFAWTPAEGCCIHSAPDHQPSRYLGHAI